MAGLDPAIHVFMGTRKIKPGENKGRGRYQGVTLASLPCFQGNAPSLALSSRA
jgi:hypothetical protein